METLTVVVSVRNEEKKLERCLESTTRLADEIIVVDNESNDKTVSTAKKFTSNIFHKKNNPMLNVNKNFGFTKATSDWILSLDADEEIPGVLGSEIKEKILKGSSGAIVGYWIPRKNIIFGKWITHGLWWPDKQLRLFRRGSGMFPERHVHEYLEVAGQSGNLETPFIHYNYDTISQFIQKMDAIYTQSEVQKLIDTNYQLAWYDAIRFPVSDFVKIYFAQGCYKDGLHGLVLSLLQSFYSFIVFAKLWESQKFKDIDIPLDAISKELKRSKQDVSYWLRTVKLQNERSVIRKIWYRILRRYAR